MKKAQKRNIKNFKKGKFSKGVLTVRLSSVKKFAKFFVDTFVIKEEFVFRGHSNANWKILSSLQRLASNKVTQDALEEHLKTFKYAARGRRGSNPRDLTNSEWWVMGQHYGLATPIVDWTRSHLVALFFAFNDRLVETNSRSVYALDLKWVEKIARDNDTGIKIIDPVLDENPRLINQASLLIQQPLQHSFEAIVKKYYSSKSDGVILIKVVMPNKDKDVKYCIRDLNRMNINHLTLFPDLTGASGYANTVFDVGIIKV